MDSIVGMWDMITILLLRISSCSGLLLSSDHESSLEFGCSIEPRFRSESKAASMLDSTHFKKNPALT